MDERRPRSEEASAGNAEVLRREMPSGRTPSQKASAEPAAAPLGTDEEAAGTPLPAAAARAELEQAREDAARQEARVSDAARSRAGRPVAAPRSYWKPALAAVLIAIAIIVAISLLG